MSFLNKLKKSLLALGTVLALSSCGDHCPPDTRPTTLTKSSPWAAILPECVAPDSIMTTLENVKFYVTEEGLPAVASFFSFLKNQFAKEHPRLGLLEQVIFYDPAAPVCQEAYGECVNSPRLVVKGAKRGETNGVNYILLNNAQRDYTKFSFADQERPIPDFFSFILRGPKGTLAHELGHILLEEKFLEMEEEDTAKYTSGAIACYEDEEHELVYRYALFAEMGYALIHPEEFAENQYFNNTLLPVLQKVLEEDPEIFLEEVESVEDFIAGWSDILQEHLYDMQPYHDLQLDFFLAQKAIVSDFPDLSYAQITPIIEDLVAEQQTHAYKVLGRLQRVAELVLQ